ncbi:MAG: hypothetical protein C4527_22595 [Candidatus Omnitrophota bacterium]|nr:MAG: hypothetical protein C4527_22595 [Candidatus Omnitrophota bacterium]
MEKKRRWGIADAPAFISVPNWLDAGMLFLRRIQSARENASTPPVPLTHANFIVTIQPYRQWEK